MKSTARRRKRFPDLKGWRLNRSGNWQIEIGDFRVTIFHKPDGWGAVVSHKRQAESAFTRERFPRFIDAQLAAFDTMARLQASQCDTSAS